MLLLLFKVVPLQIHPLLRISGSLFHLPVYPRKMPLPSRDFIKREVNTEHGKVTFPIELPINIFRP